jgi:hypothetical protein
MAARRVAGVVQGGSRSAPSGAVLASAPARRIGLRGGRRTPRILCACERGVAA